LDLKINKIKRLNVVLGDNITKLNILGKSMLKIQIGQHVEYITAIIADINEFMILGREWLAFHNPIIDWKNELITFGDNCVRNRHCAKSTTISTSTRDSIGYKNFGIHFIDEVSMARKIGAENLVETSEDLEQVLENTDRMEVDTSESGRMVTLFPSASGNRKIDGKNSENLEVTLFPSGNREEEIDGNQSGQFSGEMTLFPSLENGDHGNRRGVRFANLDEEMEVTLCTPKFLENVADVQRGESEFENKLDSGSTIEQSLGVDVKGLTNPITKGNLLSTEVDHFPRREKFNKESVVIFNDEVATSGNVKKGLTLPSLPCSDGISEEIGLEKISKENVEFLEDNIPVVEEVNKTLLNCLYSFYNHDELENGHEVHLNSMILEHSYADSGIEVDENKIPIIFKDEFGDIFVKPDIVPGLPEHRPYDMKIDLNPKKELPKPVKAYNLPPQHKEALDKYIDNALGRGFIMRIDEAKKLFKFPKDSQVMAGVFIVEQANGKKRPCVNYAPLNAVTQRDYYPMPLVDELLAEVSGAVFYAIRYAGCVSSNSY
jgi:hypothetical protein